MGKKTVYSIFLFFVLMGVLGVSINVHKVEAPYLIIFISANGSIEPSGVNITSSDNVTYAFTDNINGSIVVQRSNIIVDGNGHTLNGSGSIMYGFNLTSLSNVTIRNLNVMGFGYGIYLQSSILNIISENNITFNEGNIYLGNSSDNTITGNTITDGAEAIQLYASSNNTIAGNSISHNYNGIWSRYNSAENVISENNITANTNAGINLHYSHDNTISGNDVTNNMIGINLDSSSNNNTLNGNTVAGNSQYGIGVGGSINNVISGNKITENPGYGILLVGSSNNTLSGNNITNNNYGILLYVSSENTVSGNKIMANYICGTSLRNSSNNGIYENNITNNDIGIELDEFPNNIIYHNNFIVNTQQVQIEPSGYANFWDNGVEGNYWSNYTAVDVDGGGDGVGDGPHIIDLNNTDNHPLMGPVSFFEAGIWNEKNYYVHTTSNSTVSDFNFSESNQVVSFNVTGSNGAAGFCRVAIPRELLWCEDIFDWTVRVNGTVVPIRIQEYANYTYLYFTYSHSVQNVKIYGTHVIPEFTSFLILPLFMAATLLAVIIIRRKHRTNLRVPV
jgi:parallel beta-helix repeat protein